MKQRTIKLVLEYDGTEFAGWQTQPGHRTVQGEVEAALEKMTGEAVRVVAAGRTDAGVHALGQVVSFRTSGKLLPGQFRDGLNSLLPKDVSALEAKEAPNGFDARRSAKGKIYRYVILNRRERSAIDRNRAWHFTSPLNIEAMRKGAECLVGEHDFKSFRGQKCASKTTVRTIRRVDIAQTDDGRITFEVEATALLRQMVRAIVGTLVEVGRGKWPPERVLEALRAKDRSKAGPTAPPQGLFLVKVIYNNSNGVEATGYRRQTTG